MCLLLITFANSLDPDQDRENGCTDLVSNPFAIFIVFREEIIEKNWKGSLENVRQLKHGTLVGTPRVNLRCDCFSFLLKI